MERRAQLVAGGHLVRSRAPSSMGSWSLAACAFFLQGASFASDSLLHQRDVLGNAAASAIPFVGIIFAAIGASRRSTAKA